MPNINNWREIWRTKKTDFFTTNFASDYTPQQIVLELKRLSGYDSVGIKISYESLLKQYQQIVNELSFNPSNPNFQIGSLFEVGCAAGVNLFFAQENDLRVGGIDYSEALIEIATQVLENPVELLCNEAIHVPTDTKYDAVISNGVFSYFSDYEYASRVLEKMLLKTNYSIGLTALFDSRKEEEYIQYRLSVDKNYLQKYAGLDRLFYEKSFFIEFAEKHNLSIRFAPSHLEDYWNEDFIFNCFMTKN